MGIKHVLFCALILSLHSVEGMGYLKWLNFLERNAHRNTFAYAAHRGDLRKCRRFVAQGADVNGEGDELYTPLIAAILSEHRNRRKVIRYLLCGADINKKNVELDERTPLMF